MGKQARRTAVPSDSDFYSHQPMGGFVSRVSWYARKKMYARVLELAQPDESFTVLDVGVTSDRRVESNFFVRLYPWKHRLTAAGIEDASFLERDYPGVAFVQADGRDLPFADRHFDLTVCFAVLEHVGDAARQREFVAELCRVSKRCFITTPNRWYPMEYHTVLPLLHWLPKRWHRKLLNGIGHGFWAQEDHLNLLSAGEFRAMFPAHVQLTAAHFRLLGLVSNLCFYAENPAPG